MAAAETLINFISLLPEQLPPNPERQHIADRAAKVNGPTFQALTGTFFTLAVLAVILRTTFHIKTRGKLFVDDYLAPREHNIVHGIRHEDLHRVNSRSNVV
ncbi:hypothetical protein BDV96DRAFT_691710 [Lophiotrema nucula]|uniref:Uncharacterized protein n=1 Tax=Lophiotrema nucula TaxID=690887 RepID=A0A6A5YR18_9PLEO|nr:hypothetical protein BDV96DRAFT_691710 [Lophiotrema nucula]